ncbi:SH3 domain-containing protein [Sphingobacterium sp. T2]|nr:SH3 domain-containing protein [Sphingobacterium sp. T2]
MGQAAKGEVITLLNRANSLWWLIRTVNGIEGYCYAEYLEPIK